MGTKTLSASQESDLYPPDIMSELTQHVCRADWDKLMAENPYPEEEKYTPQNQQVMQTPEQYIDQMTLPPAFVPPTGVCMKSTANCPSLDEFVGPYNFQANLQMQNAGKNTVYSDGLHKVFINVDQLLPLRFKWNPHRPDLYLRIMMVYTFDQYRAEPVKRCLNHQGEHNTVNGNVHVDIRHHVVRCTDPRSVYLEQNGHNCIMVPLGTPQNGCEYVPLSFQFFCKNSCMLRRSTDLVFTLESGDGEVLGRQNLQVRVCSCPKRDKEKEEEGIIKNLPQSSKKRRITPKKPPMSVPNSIITSCTPGKRPLIQHVPSAVDNREYFLQIKVLGRENARLTLKAAHGIMASDAALTGEHAPFVPHLTAIQRQMEQLF